jgi:hypothetical protein
VFLTKNRVVRKSVADCVTQRLFCFNVSGGDPRAISFGAHTAMLAKSGQRNGVRHVGEL